MKSPRRLAAAQTRNYARAVEEIWKGKEMGMTEGLVPAEGRFYIARNGDLIGPLERGRGPDGHPPGLWGWRFKHPAEGWLNWTDAGRWHREPGKESAWDLVREATQEEMNILQPETKKESTTTLHTRSTEPVGSDLVLARVAEHWNSFGRNVFGPAWLVELTSEHIAVMLSHVTLAKLEASPGELGLWTELAGQAAERAQQVVLKREKTNA